MSAPSRRRLARLALALAVLGAVPFLRGGTPTASAVDPAITAPSATSVQTGQTVALAGFTVSGPALVGVQLDVSPTTAGTISLGCGATCTGVTYEIGTGTADTSLEIVGTPTDLNAALAQLSFASAADGTATITGSARDAAFVLNPANRHFYRFYPGGWLWSNNVATASAATYYGLTGYLATLTSSAEIDFARDAVHHVQASGTPAVGLSDEDVNGTWKWVTGPEAGTVEPNPKWYSGSPVTGEHVARLRVDAPGGGSQWAFQTWDATTTCCGYLVEFGDGGGTFAPPTASVQITSSTPPTTTIRRTTTTTTSTTVAPTTTLTPTTVLTVDTATPTTTPDTAPVTSAPTNSGGGGGGGGGNGGPPSTSWRAKLRLKANVGDIATGQPVIFDGVGLKPRARVEGGVHSTYQRLVVGRTDAKGAFHLDGVLPAGLEPGVHAIELRYLGSSVVLDTASFTLTADGRIDTFDDRLGVQPPGAPQPYSPGDDVGGLLALGVSALIIAGAVGDTSGSSSNSSSGTSDQPQEASGPGSVSEIDVKVRAVSAADAGPGDRARTWRSPGTERVDRWYADAPHRLAKHLPMIANSLGDSSYLRAMVGSPTMLLPFAGVGVGLAAAADAHFEAVPPSAALVALAIVLSAFDSLTGVCMAAAYGLSVLVAGGIGNLDAFLTVCGVGVLFVGTPFVAAAARPLTRPSLRSATDLWDRLTDLVLGGLFTAWAIQGMVGALPGLHGYELPLTAHGNSLAVLAGCMVALRVVVESAAAQWFPVRLAAVTPTNVPKPPLPRQYVTVLVRTALFVLAAYQFIGINGWLIGGSLMYLVPGIVGLHKEQLPVVRLLYAILPRALLKTCVMLVVGTLWGRFVAANWHGTNALQVGFVILGIPGLVVGSLAMFGRSGPALPYRWWQRLAGVALVVFGVLKVTGHFFGF